MNIQLGNTTSPQRKIYKDFTVGVTKTIRFLKDENVCAPKVLLDYAVGIDRYNYAYIPELHRYYWVSEITEVTGGMCMLVLNVDVLMTYKPEIDNADLMISRSTSIGTSMIPDSKLPLYPYKAVRYAQFEEAPFFNNLNDATPCFILNVAGK